MQHPTCTNYNHENAPPDPKQTNYYKGWKTKKQTKIIKVHYIIFIFYFLQKHLQHRLQKKMGGWGFLSGCSLYSTMIITARGRRKREIKSLELRNHVLKKERQKKRNTRSSLKVPPPIPVYASRGSDSICLLNSPPGKLYMESHTGSKYKLTLLSQAWVSFSCWRTEPSPSPRCRRQRPGSGAQAPAVLGEASPWPSPLRAAGWQPLGRGQELEERW